MQYELEAVHACPTVIVENLGDTYIDDRCLTASPAGDEWIATISAEWTVSGGFDGGRGDAILWVLDPTGIDSRVNIQSYSNDGGSGPHPVSVSCGGMGCTMAGDFTIRALRTSQLIGLITGITKGCRDVNALNYGGPAPCVPPPSSPPGPFSITSASVTCPPGSTQVSLSWSVSANATSYNIYRRIGVSGGWVLIFSGVTGTSIGPFLEGRGIDLYFYVEAIGAVGPSSQTAPVYGGFCPVTTVCSDGIDVGLRLYQDGIRKIAVYPGGALTSPLRVYKNGVHAVVLVDPTDSNATRMHVQTATGIRATCILP